MITEMPRLSWTRHHRVKIGRERFSLHGNEALFDEGLDLCIDEGDEGYRAATNVCERVAQRRGGLRRSSSSHRLKLAAET